MPGVEVIPLVSTEPPIQGPYVLVTIRDGGILQPEHRPTEDVVGYLREVAESHDLEGMSPCSRTGDTTAFDFSDPWGKLVFLNDETEVTFIISLDTLENELGDLGLETSPGWVGTRVGTDPDEVVVYVTGLDARGLEKHLMTVVETYQGQQEPPILLHLVGERSPLPKDQIEVLLQILSDRYHVNLLHEFDSTAERILQAKSQEELEVGGW